MGDAGQRPILDAEEGWHAGDRVQLTSAVNAGVLTALPGRVATVRNRDRLMLPDPHAERSALCDETCSLRD